MYNCTFTVSIINTKIFNKYMSKIIWLIHREELQADKCAVSFNCSNIMW